MPHGDDYGRAFRIIRAAFGLRQSELATRMAISASQLSLVEAGKRQPSIRVIKSLADAVGIPTALVTLIAAGGDESKSNANFADLSKALLHLLVTGKESHQQGSLI